MADMARIENGKIQETASQSSLSKTNKSTPEGMDKDAFLQLLVAQMKYQDPLEPTSNTEYISQYAQFSQVEQMQNMSGSMDLQRASSLVGQEVYMKTTTSSGEAKYVQGKVDYVVYENKKAYLSIEDNLYALEDLDTVADSDYMVAVDLAKTFQTKMDKLPNVENLTLSDTNSVEELQKLYNGMTDYQKKYISMDLVASLTNYSNKISEISNSALLGGDETLNA